MEHLRKFMRIIYTFAKIVIFLPNISSLLLFQTPALILNFDFDRKSWFCAISAEDVLRGAVKINQWEAVPFRLAVNVYPSWGSVDNR